ncbi:MAG: hypothetical protein ACYDBL_04430 [Candidatus Acidiferrales bacterium]
MKLRYALLIALALMLSAGLARANPVDPTVILNDPPDMDVSSSCPANAICIFGSSVIPPIIVLQLVKGFLPPISFQYTGPTTSTFFVVLDEVLPGETFTCSSNFLSCSLITNIDVFDFDNDGVIFAFNGTLQTGTTLTAAVSTPEPSLISQLLIGIVPLFFFGRKYWIVDHAA